MRIRGLRELLSSGGYLAAFALVFGLDGSGPRLLVVSVATGLACVAWFVSHRRLRAVADTPTSRIGSAAQGYVELIGEGRPDPQREVLSPLHRLPCLWYRYRAYARQGDAWVRTEGGESSADFYLDDGSGRCRLSPADADILSSRREVHQSGDHKVEEELLLIGTRLYALGEFVSLDGDAGFDVGSELQEVLNEWKDDPAELRQRFDLDGDGRIDPQEWTLARQAAHREVESRQRHARRQPAHHHLTRPRHGRPYLIADFPPETLARRYRLRSLLHAGAALAGLFIAGWVLRGS